MCRVSLSASGYLSSLDYTSFNNYLRPVTLGFSQQLMSSFTSTDNYVYKMGGPTSFTPLSAQSYAAWWIDRGGYGTAGGTTTVAPADFELFRLSAVTQANTRENTLEIFDYTTQGLGSVPGSFFNEAGVNSYTGPSQISMYGINTHTSGCNGTKCGGSQTDYDIQQIGIESDVEERSGFSGTGHTSGKRSAASIGIYSVCADCNNSGQAGASFSPNIAFLAQVKTPGGGGNSPWGVAFDSAPASALVGVVLWPLALSGPADSQPIEQIAFDPSGDQLETTLATTQGSAFTISAPGLTEVINPAGLQSTHYGGLATAAAPSPTAGTALTTAGASVTVSGTDVQGTLAISSSTVGFSASHQLATITFGVPYANPPNCLVSQNISSANGYNLGVGHSTPTKFLMIISASIANTTAATYLIDYVCSGS